MDGLVRLLGLENVGAKLLDTAKILDILAALGRPVLQVVLARGAEEVALITFAGSLDWLVVDEDKLEELVEKQKSFVSHFD